MSYSSNYLKSIQNSESFWKEQASKIDWFESPQKILSKDKDDLFRWYQGGKLDTSYLALDYDFYYILIFADVIHQKIASCLQTYKSCSV